MIKNNVAKYRKGVNYSEIFEQLSLSIPNHEEKLTDVEVREVITSLVAEDLIVVSGSNKLKPTVKLNKDNYLDTK